MGIPHKIRLQEALNLPRLRDPTLCEECLYQIRSHRLIVALDIFQRSSYAFRMQKSPNP